MAIEIRSLSGLSHQELFAAFQEAFIDYEFKWTWEQFEKMIYRRGFSGELSFGAFDNDKLVSFTLNCIGDFNGTKSAYDTGSGTIKEYRGRGLATNIFKTSLPFLKQAGVKHYLLDVLQTNTKAISVYSNLGFKTTRELNYFFNEAKEIPAENKIPAIAIEIREIGLDYKSEIQQFQDCAPAWQNSFESVERMPSYFKIIGAFYQNKIVGYGIIDIAVGDIPQLAVEKSFRRKGVGSAILKELLRLNTYHTARMVNTDACCESLNAFLPNKGIPKRGGTFEMKLEII